jgi:trehalose-6-phosphate synthase
LLESLKFRAIHKGKYGIVRSMRRLILFILLVSCITGFIVILFTSNQANTERQRLMSDMELRSNLIVEGMREPVTELMIGKSEYLDSYINSLVSKGAMRGIVVMDTSQRIVASSDINPFPQLQDEQKLAKVFEGNTSEVELMRDDGAALFYYLTPLYDGSRLLGALVLVQDASYIDSRIGEIWRGSMLRLFIQVFLLIVSFGVVLRWLFLGPIYELSGIIRSDDGQDLGSKKKPSLYFLQPIVEEIFQMRKSLIEARVMASEEARLRLNKIDAAWTASRLAEYIKRIARNRQIILVSNREPYVHEKQKNGTITYNRPASGLVSALEPIMRATEGTWIAYGGGSADKLVVDRQDKVRVPPGEPRYGLKRVWLNQQQVKGHYEGFSNEVLWPLCHNVHVRPIFRLSDWNRYQEVNRIFASKILSEIRGKKSPMIVGVFWHIPWPTAESFSICPWKNEILEGMLGADLIGFHVQLFCNNFLNTVNKSLEALLNWEQYTVSRDQHVTLVKPFPISINFTDSTHELSAEAMQEHKKQLLTKYDIHADTIGIGVDRLDYTKGLIERLKAIDLLLEKRKNLVGHFSFVQIAAPSRGKIDAYKSYATQVEAEVTRINEKYQKGKWKPIIFINKHKTAEEILEFYRAAQICLVTPLHDGMNLVAKEFVAARSDLQGVLVLSKFTGAARDLTDALVINPYDAQNTMQAIDKGLRMSRTEQRKRMKRMRENVRTYNVYRWSAEYMQTLINMT